MNIPLPKLQEGFEGPDAERDAALHNCAPAVPGTRTRYEAIKTIETPQGWTLVVAWSQGGEPVLTLQSPYFGFAPDRFGVHQHWFEARVRVTDSDLQPFDRITPDPANPVVRVDGVMFPTAHRSGSTFLPSVSTWEKVVERLRTVQYTHALVGRKAFETLNLPYAECPALRLRLDEFIPEDEVWAMHTAELIVRVRVE